jgi:hypothetical protein
MSSDASSPAKKSYGRDDLGPQPAKGQAGKNRELSAQKRMQLEGQKSSAANALAPQKPPPPP